MINFLPLLFKYRNIWGLGIVLAILALFIWRFTYLQGENARLEGELLKANSAIEKLSALTVVREDIRRGEEDLLRSIDNEPESADGPIAPVLRSAVERLSNNSD